jgi:hypothetical protein
MKADFEKIWNNAKEWPWTNILLAIWSFCWAIPSIYWGTWGYFFGKYASVYDGPPIDMDKITRIGIELNMRGWIMFFMGVYSLTKVIKFFKNTLLLC